MSLDNRQFPHGKMSGDDEGELAIRMAADHEHNVVLIDFGEQGIKWLGLDVESAEQFIKLIEDKIDELKAGTPDK